MANAKPSGTQTSGTQDKIACDVKNCAFHSGATACVAPKIKVGPDAAARSDQTCCSTFKDKSGAK